MPKRTDIKKILIIGSGPIIIGQACEFDYSGTQACKALRDEGYEVILINSNPATIMTDPNVADRTYVEPITPEFVERVIAQERPDALLPTLGGQTGLNTAIRVAEAGVLKKYNVEMIGARYEAIKCAEERHLFKKAMQEIGLDLPKSGLAHTYEEAVAIAKKIGFPLVVRPSFTLGGTGGGFCPDETSFEQTVRKGLEYSMTHECLIEESIRGWKEYELEVMRDLRDNVVIICSIENFDPMGVHTGDSITVAPAQTLTDKEYQKMRDAALAVIRKIGVETGGSNIQFALHPGTGRMVVIEMNPRVSRSSALASKATGFPIAKFAAKLAVGLTLDEIPNDITRQTPACFEPTIDYCVVKIPRFAFEKFPGVDDELGVQMKSVGETMAIGRTFKEALQKGLRGLEAGHDGLGVDGGVPRCDSDTTEKLLARPTTERIHVVRDALREGRSVSEVHKITQIDPWFLENMKQIVELEKELEEAGRKGWIIKGHEGGVLLRKAKEYGFSDAQLARLLRADVDTIRALRKRYGIEAVFKRVDTCAAEFEAYTPYYYSSYESEDESKPSKRKKIMILGGGPNRIGQGIEFDYCCCQASYALKEIGFETIMVNSNPETVSTDYDTSDRLYFEPVTAEDVLNIVDREKPDGVIVQFGGQTPLNLAVELERAGVPIIGTPPDAIDRVEDRKRFKELLDKLGLLAPPSGTATSFKEAEEAAARIGFPVVVRPSYVLGGRAMEIVYDTQGLQHYMRSAVRASPKHPVLLDRFLENAVEIDVDMIADGEDFVIGGIMEHIEEAGVHSGDSACVLPPHTLDKKIVQEIAAQTRALSKEIGVIGLMNVQFAVKDSKVYILEVNPRASRTVPFVSKATGASLAKLAAQVMAGKKLRELGFVEQIVPKHISVKESVLPFVRFPGVDIILGPEMRSTGEVMGIDTDFGKAFAKSQVAAGQSLPTKGTVFVSVMDRDKPQATDIAKRLKKLGFTLIATRGTAKHLSEQGVEVDVINKIADGSPHVGDRVRQAEIDLIINTPNGKGPMLDEGKIRSLAVSYGIPIITTIQGARAAVSGIEELIKGNLKVKSLQAYHRDLATN